MRAEIIGNCRLILGDCMESLRKMPDNSVDSIVTDPPYGLAFMGKKWDYDVPSVEIWAECLRVLKPGGYLLAFSGTRTQHRMVCAIEDAGFEIRDTIMWLYGTGFPKSHNLDGEWDGWGTALKPAFEPVIMARKPLIGTVEKNVRAHGTGAINIDGCRVEGVKGVPASPRRADQNAAYGDLSKDPGTGSGWDPNVGRFPANVIHDGSDEVEAAFPHTKSGKPGVMRLGENTGAAYGAESRAPGTPMTGFGDEGSASRFFYCAKATKAERVDSKHPTVKPIALMRYLCRLVTPPGGTVLDPFAGTGTTGQAAQAEGFNAVLIERELEYQADIRRRLGLVDPEIEEMLS